MDSKIVWSPEAIEDVEAIAEYISRDSISHASAVTEKIIHTVNSLRDMPYSGRMVPEIENEHVREKFVYSYRIIYRINQHQILIIAVIHGKRLMEDLEGRT